MSSRALKAGQAALRCGSPTWRSFSPKRFAAVAEPPVDAMMSSPQHSMDFAMGLGEPRKAVTFNEEDAFIRTVSSLDDRQIQLGKDPHPPKTISHSHLPRAGWTERGATLDLNLPNLSKDGLFARRFVRRTSGETMDAPMQL
eukprot:GGOE01042672.1.p3 GENE.GGOE01042672.1~~GGOE01042672.1.p3  ORF type:complete len:151 (+),score=40.54 GGOE01042672.1:29-454(+)